jgi:hypothetical protein
MVACQCVFCFACIDVCCQDNSALIINNYLDINMVAYKCVFCVAYIDVCCQGIGTFIKKYQDMHMNALHGET